MDTGEKVHFSWPTLLSPDYVPRSYIDDSGKAAEASQLNLMNKDIRGVKIHQIEITPVSMSEIIIMLLLLLLLADGFVFLAFFIFPSSAALPRDDAVDGGVF